MTRLDSLGPEIFPHSLQKALICRNLSVPTTPDSTRMGPVPATTVVGQGPNSNNRKSGLSGSFQIASLEHCSSIGPGRAVRCYLPLYLSSRELAGPTLQNKSNRRTIQLSLLGNFRLLQRWKRSLKSTLWNVRELPKPEIAMSFDRNRQRHLVRAFGYIHFLMMLGCRSSSSWDAER